MTRALLSEAAVWSLARVLWLNPWVLPCSCAVLCPEPHRCCMGTGWAGSWVPAGARFVGGKSLLAGMPRCCKTSLRAPRCSRAAGSQHGAAHGVPGLSLPATASPVPAPASSGNSLASGVILVYFSPILARFLFAQSLAAARGGVSALPAAPRASPAPSPRVLPCR